MSSYSRFNYLEQYKNMHIILEENFNEKRGALWLGDYSAALDRETLKQKGINTVLTTAQGLSLYYPLSSKIQHKQWFMLDHPCFNISRYFQEVIQEIEEGLRRGGVLVHCAAGVSRSATSVISYLMQRKKMSYLNAISFVRKRRRVISPNPGFLKQLQQFEKQLQSNQEIRRSSLSRNTNILSTTNPMGFRIIKNPNNQDYSDPIFGDSPYHNYRATNSLNQIYQRGSIEKSNSAFDQNENPQVIVNSNEKNLHNLTKQTSILPQENILKPKNTSEKKAEDKNMKNSMELIKSKSHKFILKKSDSKGTIRLNRNNSIQPNNLINVQKQVEQSEIKSVPQTTKSNSQQSIFDMLYVQQQHKKKVQTKPKKSVPIIAQSQNQIQPVFISQAQKNLRKTFSYLNTKENGFVY